MSIKLHYWKWWDKKPNAGDHVVKWLFDKLKIDYEITTKGTADLYSVGSILGNTEKDDYLRFFGGNTKVWGSGFINYSATNDIIKPENIYAVRGHLTREKLGVECPVGDPGILIGKYFKNNFSKKYKLLILLHRRDYEDLKNIKFIGLPERTIIKSVVTDNIDELAKTICESEFVLSSSLHGIIFAHSLGVPAAHFENKVLRKGNFKFLDYYSTLDIPYTKFKTNNHVFDYSSAVTNNKLLPSSECIEKLQDDLIKAFPYSDRRSKFYE